MTRPGRWDAVVDIIGADHARALQRALGGRYLWLPVPRSAASELLALVIGHRAVDALRAAGVRYAYVPRLPNVDDIVAMTEARAWLRAGVAPSVVARAMNRSTRWAQRLRRSAVQEVTHA